VQVNATNVLTTGQFSTGIVANGVRDVTVNIAPGGSVSGGWQADLTGGSSLEGTYFQTAANSIRGVANNFSGRGFAASIEGGYPIVLVSWLTFEPQIQGIWRRSNVTVSKPLEPHHVALEIGLPHRAGAAESPPQQRAYAPGEHVGAVERDGRERIQRR
jgi:Autotransporter beta-domain